ncbi:MAG: hypothetical protein WAK17_18990 [Candidatus Nitrosopolaris sp.]|jgi:hypothetical protein
MALAHGTPDGTGSLVYSKLDDTRIRVHIPRSSWGLIYKILMNALKSSYSLTMIGGNAM